MARLNAIYPKRSEHASHAPLLLLLLTAMQAPLTAMDSTTARRTHSKPTSLPPAPDSWTSQNRHGAWSVNNYRRVWDDDEEEDPRQPRKPLRNTPHDSQRVVPTWEELIDALWRWLTDENLDDLIRKFPAPGTPKYFDKNIVTPYMFGIRVLTTKCGHPASLNRSYKAGVWYTRTAAATVVPTWYVDASNTMGWQWMHCARSSKMPCLFRA